MNENNFMRVEDVAKELGISISHSYKVMQQLNKELKAKGYMTIAGMFRTAKRNINLFIFSSARSWRLTSESGK